MEKFKYWTFKINYFSKYWPYNSFVDLLFFTFVEKKVCGYHRFTTKKSQKVHLKNVKKAK